MIRVFIKSLSLAVSLTNILVFGLTCAVDAQQPRQGGILVYLDKQTHLNLYPPLTGNYTSGGIMNQITDRLTWQNPQTLAIEPWLARSWEINQDATQFTFHLRAGVTFSDKTPLDAAIVAKNFDTFGLGNEQLRLPISEVINNYDHSEIVDPLTVRFYFKKPSPGFLQGTSVIGSGIVAAKTLNTPLDQLGDATKIIGSGPFVVDSETLGKELDLKVRDDYNWGPVNFVHQGRAYLDGLKYITVPEDSVRIGALIAHQAGFIRQLQAYDEARVRSSGNIVYAVGTRGVNDSIIFRPDNPIVGDIRVRQALVLAIDRQAIINTLFSENYPIAKSIIAHDAFGYNDLSGKLVFDPKKAEQLLEGAGWVRAVDGIRAKDGQKLILTATEAAQLPQNKAVLQMVSQQWRKLGVILNVKNYDGSTTLIENLDPSKVPVIGGMVGRADPDVIKSLFYPRNRDVLLQKGGISDKVKTFRDDKLNRKLEDIAAEINPERRRLLTQQVSEYLIDQAYALPIFEDPQVYGGASNVKAINFEAVGRPYFYNTWIEH